MFLGYKQIIDKKDINLNSAKSINQDKNIF